MIFLLPFPLDQYFRLSLQLKVDFGEMSLTVIFAHHPANCKTHLFLKARPGLPYGINSQKKTWR